MICTPLSLQNERGKQDKFRLNPLFDFKVLLQLPCAGTHDSHSLAGQVNRMVPSGRVPHVSLEGFKLLWNLGNTKQARSMKDHVNFSIALFIRARVDPMQDPLLAAFIPPHACDSSVETDLVVNVVCSSRGLEVFQDFALRDIPLGPVVVGRERVAVQIGKGIQAGAWVRVVCPDTANVGLEFKNSVGEYLKLALKLDCRTDARYSEKVKLWRVNGTT